MDTEIVTHVIYIFGFMFQFRRAADILLRVPDLLILFGNIYIHISQRLMDPQAATCLRSKTLAVRVKNLAMRVQ